MTNAEIYEKASAERGEYKPPALACPACGKDAPCYAWEEVDIGVGVQVFEEEWVCLEHGVFRMSSTTLEYIFRDAPELTEKQIAHIVEEP